MASRFSSTWIQECHRRNTIRDEDIGKQVMCSWALIGVSSNALSSYLFNHSDLDDMCGLLRRLGGLYMEHDIDVWFRFSQDQSV